MKKNVKYILFVAVLLLLGCEQETKVDPLKRSRVDGLNKDAFIHRYKHPDRCLDYAENALTYVHDSLPEYVDGELRALNNMAFAYYQMSDYSLATEVLEDVDSLVAQKKKGMKNGDVEAAIARLLKARLLQRSCHIADSYRLLYDIGKSDLFDKEADNLLYNYAKAEYYITLLTLNFHYRDGKESDVMSTIAEIEQRRKELKVDYAEDMALNYAIAYGLQSAGESARALEYCECNFDILFNEHNRAFCLYHYGNTMQMTASVLKNIPGAVPADSILALYDRAREAFFEYGDPYQMLGGVTSTARYALLIGDTLTAHDVLSEWRSMRGTWKPFSAPKMELGYFDVLIRSCLAESPDENRRWYEHRCELQDYVTQNEKEDFALQNSLSTANRRSRMLTMFSYVLGALLLILVVLVVLLWRVAWRLRREKRQLQEAKRRDVERIANVETCLSVMRHDVSPFIGYLRNPDLPTELRSEVLEQLLRTFDNIKNWTHLSIPSGLQFQPSVFALGEVFESLSASCARLEQDVDLIFYPTTLQVRGDRQLVEIMLRNLVNNALQHTGEGKVTIYSEVYPADDRFVHIEVDDTGTGMDATTLENLFRADRKIQPHPDSQAPHGTGFGLILCRYIIKLHDDNTLRGCRIWAESAPGKGSTFHCLLAGEGNKGWTPEPWREKNKPDYGTN